VDEARIEAKRMIDALAPFVHRDVPVIGLEPSCLLTLRDEWQCMFPADVIAPFAKQGLLFEEFLVAESERGALRPSFAEAAGKRVLLHGHCHQKAFDAMPAIERALRLIPGLVVETVASSCCGMAGAFGYEAEHFAVSMRMAEASLLPAVRKAAADTIIVADGTSCRHQIHDGAGRAAVHVAQVLRSALQRRAASG
jgi:Fe-S oxidoreductase